MFLGPATRQKQGVDVLNDCRESFWPLAQFQESDKSKLLKTTHGQCLMDDTQRVCRGKFPAIVPQCQKCAAMGFFPCIAVRSFPPKDTQRSSKRVHSPRIRSLLFFSQPVRVQSMLKAFYVCIGDGF
jgi:hypothetical protein